MSDYIVHPSACVDDTVSIGARTRVWQFATVIRGTVLGRDCVVAAGANLDGPKIGDRCIVSPGVDMGPGFEIGDDVFLGPHVVLCNDVWPRVDKEGFDYEGLRSGCIVSVRIGDGTSLGVRATVMPGVTIGQCCMIAAHAVVDRNVPDWTLYRRDGSMVPIDTKRIPARTRSC